MPRKRISKVTTRTGDGGKTKLATGRTIGKHERVVSSMGAVDELNSHVGVLKHQIDQAHLANLNQIQQVLFDIGAVFAMEGEFNSPQTLDLEEATETLNETLPPLTEFVLPGGGAVAAQSHICRAVCRRAESCVWHFIYELQSKSQTQAPTAYADVARYLNRLSDYFFVLARYTTVDIDAEAQWQGPKK